MTQIQVAIPAGQSDIYNHKNRRKEVKNVYCKGTEHCRYRIFFYLASGISTITLQSRNTGHCWHILLQEYAGFQSCRIYHTHHRGTPYHEHGHGATLSGCLSQIRNHDAYWLSRKSHRKIGRAHV